MSTIWSDDFLNQLEEDAHQQINQDVQCVFEKSYFPTTKGLSLYTLPSFVRSVRRITWLGKRLDPVSWDELIALSPATVAVNQSQFSEESVVSRPLYYAMHPTNPYAIRFFPTPDLSLPASGGNPYATIANEQFCCLSYWRTTDESSDKTSLPQYIARRTKKSYILGKAYEAEGKGQNLAASKYYLGKYSRLIKRFIAINTGCFVGKKYTLGDGLLELNAYRYPRPTLNPNFERVIF